MNSVLKDDEAEAAVIPGTINSLINLSVHRQMEGIHSLKSRCQRHDVQTCYI